MLSLNVTLQGTAKCTVSRRSAASKSWASASWRQHFGRESAVHRPTPYCERGQNTADDCERLLIGCVTEPPPSVSETAAGKIDVVLPLEAITFRLGHEQVCGREVVRLEVASARRLISRR